jgi:membrane associated rhomboid family serine protease
MGRGSDARIAAYMAASCSDLVADGLAYHRRAVILGFVFGGIAGGVTGGIEGALGATRETMLWSTKLAGQVAGFIASLIWLFFVLRMALRKRYSDFRLALIVDNSN